MLRHLIIYSSILVCNKLLVKENTDSSLLLSTRQIWDFNLGRSRNHNENSALEIGFGSNSGGFMIKSYNDMLKEISSGTTKDLEDIYDSGYCAAAEDIMSTNICQLPSKNVSRFPCCFNFCRHSMCLSSAFGA
jgi:hypothetical protein